MVNTAVILAAGMGSRLGNRTIDVPKGFVEIENISLIERSLCKLYSSGIKNVYIGTGYLAELYKKLSDKYPGIICVDNNDYVNTGSMYTLYKMHNFIKEDFLLLESDLLYEINALKTLLSDKREDIILASGKTNSDDEVYIETDNDNLVNMSKNPEKLNKISSELVGISKISVRTLNNMVEFSEKAFLSNLKLDYEYALVGVSKLYPIPVKKIEDLAWCEIDNEEHLNRAINTIFPRIKEREYNG